MRLQHSVISHLIRVYEERERLMNILDLTVSVKLYPRLLMNANANFQIPHLVKKNPFKRSFKYPVVCNIDVNSIEPALDSIGCKQRAQFTVSRYC